MLKRRFLLWLIIIITVISVYIDLPKVEINFEKGPIKVHTTAGGYSLGWSVFGIRFSRDLKVKKGLDLQGGLSVVLQANMSDIEESERDLALESAKNVIERRVNFFGVTEPNIYTSRVADEYRVIVELPGVTNTKQALELIGQTAQLDFREQISEDKPFEFEKTDLTGKDLTLAQVTFDRSSGKPQVALKFTEEGGKKFEEITKRNIDKPLAIFLDEKILSAPIVQGVISGGEAVITGQFTVEQAKNLAIQLNAGALPVPISILEQRNIGATLGEESIEKSVKAGLVGLLLVAFFMWAYYGRLGFLANFALIIYGLVTLALYKLIPVTLTLAGIAGFTLSIGMAVDSNILIFEKIKEELRLSKSIKTAMELGFGRALDSIKDANVCTLITCFVLFNPFGWSFLNTSGIVRGFALTLGLGVVISLFTGVIVTRTLVRVFYR